MQAVKKPIRRSALRSRLGGLYYSARRHCLWIKMRKSFASGFADEPLPFLYYQHKTILLRKLQDVDMWMQHNKIKNLTLAAQRLNGLILRPGEIFSYWKLIGHPSKAKGYVAGMVLHNGSFGAGIGGGLCQLSNLIFWMTVHTPLTVIERHRHGFDVFPDSNRTQPFGSGATCFYPHGDLMIQNDTQETYQLLISVGEVFLEGEWRVSAQPQNRYEIVERNHEMRGEYWGGYTRHNQLYQQVFDYDDQLLDERLLIENAAIMMYAPFLSDTATTTTQYDPDQETRD